MVQCAVGFSCNACLGQAESTAGRTGSQSAKLSAGTYVKVILGAVAVGFLLNLLYRCTSSAMWSLIQLILIALCGMAGGMFLHKLAGFKSGRKLAPWVGSGVLLGVFIDPTWLFLIPMALMQGEFTALLMPVLSVVTVLVPFIQDHS